VSATTIIAVILEFVWVQLGPSICIVKILVVKEATALQHLFHQDYFLLDYAKKGDA